MTNEERMPHASLLELLDRKRCTSPISPHSGALPFYRRFTAHMFDAANSEEFCSRL